METGLISRGRVEREGGEREGERERGRERDKRVKRERERERETDRERERKRARERQTDKQTDRQTDRQTEKDGKGVWRKGEGEGTDRETEKRIDRGKTNWPSDNWIGIGRESREEEIKICFPGCLTPLKQCTTHLRSTYVT